MGCRKRTFSPAGLEELLVELAWENRDIHPSHLAFFRGAVIIPAKNWNRNTEWDNILGYYDPQDQYLKLHEDLLASPFETSGGYAGCARRIPAGTIYRSAPMD